MVRAASAALHARAVARVQPADVAALQRCVASSEAARVAFPLGCVRCASHAAAPDAAPAPPPLKAVLRQLYLKVHPDLFTDAPAEQATNQKSFILLQEYLALAESGAEPHGRSQAFAFEFYIRDEAAPEGTGGDAGGGARGQLRRVALTLPPPGRRAGGHSSGSLPPATALALGRLFDACGLESAFSGGAGVAPPDGLLDMLPGAAEALRQAHSNARTPDDLLRMARAALRMGRGVMLSFAPSAPTGARAARSWLA